MPRVVFWNTNKGRNVDALRHLADRFLPDILLVAELGLSPSSVLRALRGSLAGSYKYKSDPKDKVQVFSVFGSNVLKRRFSNALGSAVGFTLRVPSTQELSMLAIHLPSKFGFSDKSQEIEATNLRRDIELFESSVGHDRTVVVGDFNMMPFEASMGATTTLYALMDKKLVTGGSRVVQGQSYRYFYNPMWSLLGDLTPGPPGTMYYFPPEHHSYGWSMLDQVLLRPSIMHALVPDSLQVIDDPMFSDVNGRPGGTGNSDHFPITFALT